MSKAIGNDVAAQSRLLLGEFEDGVQVFRRRSLLSTAGWGETASVTPLMCERV
jgi:hypothetical protein